MALSWIGVLIIQPFLIRKNNWKLHRRTGRAGHIIMVLFYLSVILLTHHQESSNPSPQYIGVFIPFKDLVILSVVYFIGMRYRKQTGIHARAMISTGVVFIEPALIRAVGTLFPALENRYLWTIGIIYLILVAAIISTKNIKKGRWVFPLVLCMYVVVHSIIVYRIPLEFFETAAAWFLRLPLT